MKLIGESEGVGGLLAIDENNTAFLKALRHRCTQQESLVKHDQVVRALDFASQSHRPVIDAYERLDRSTAPFYAKRGERLSMLPILVESCSEYFTRDDTTLPTASM